MLSQINNSDFLDFLLSHKNSVFILEDCDILIQSRDKGGNGLINSLLNMSDGILGDSLNIKFIGTFNTHVSNIDKALQRKGRLKIMHELKPLTKEKVEKIFKTLDINEVPKSMTLAEVYNYYVDNGTNQPKNKIGF